MRALLPWFLVCAVACGKSADDNCTNEVPYDGIDQDCNGSDLVDQDNDGYVAVEAGGDDCDDGSPGIHPGVEDVPYDGFDQDCEGGDLVDVDGDGHDAEIVEGDDCDDEAADTYPGAEDLIGDGIDQDCDGTDGTDADGDGFAAVSSGGDDCDDNDATRNPAAEEIWYDGIDQDCDGGCDYDQDGDAAVLTGTIVTDGSPCDLDPFPGALEFFEDCNDLNPTASTVAVETLFPLDGETEVSPLALVIATLTQQDSTATLVVFDELGAVVPGTNSQVGLVMTFEADIPYDYSLTYTVEVSHGCAVETFDFTVQTSPIPVDATQLPGRVWEFNAGDGLWTEPPGVGPILAPLVDLPLLISVITEGTSVLDLRVAPTDSPGVQDICTETTEVLGADFIGNPTFVFGPVDLTADISGITGTLSGLIGSGTFSANMSRIDNMVLAGNLDTRPLVDLVTPGGAPNTICTLLILVGAPCTPCPDLSGTFCIDVRVEDLDALEVPAATLVERTVAQIAADPLCP